MHLTPETVLWLLAKFCGKLATMTSGQRLILQRRFLRAIADESHFQILFEHLPGVSFFAKDAEGRIMRANRAFRERLEFEREEDIIGRTDFELFPEGLADNFRRDDLEVMSSGSSKLGLVELFLNQRGLVDWFVTNKLPIFDRKGVAIGVMGTVQKYELQRRLSYPFPEIEKAVEYIRQRFRESIRMSDLARHVGLSVRHFDRKFKQALSIGPKSFQIKTRIQSACESLRQSGISVGELAFELGFSDQSSFTLLFRREMGMTPLKYRQSYRS
jgi:PAS domain S-box-containing protein